MGLGARPGFSHEALLHDSDEELLATVVPFLSEGADAGESAVICCTAPTAGLVMAQMGDDSRIAYLVHDDVYSAPTAAITAYQEIVDRYVSEGAERVRVVGEATWSGRPQEWAEWSRYEAVVNRAMLGYPVHAICTYDTQRVPAQVLASARRTHPALVSRDTRTRNPHYVEPARYLRQTMRAEPDPLESADPNLEIDDLWDLDRLRRRLEAALFGRTHAAETVADFVLATNEVATNAKRFGRRPISLRIWVRPDRLLCRVTDQGDGFDDPFAGYIWPGTRNDAPTHGMGLWLARRLCDRVDIFGTEQGFTVRLMTGIGAPRERLGRHRNLGYGGAG